MVAIASSSKHRELSEQLQELVARCREMVDAFVSDRMRRAAAEAQCVQPKCTEHPNEPPHGAIPPTNPTIPGPSNRAKDVAAD